MTPFCILLSLLLLSTDSVGTDDEGFRSGLLFHSVVSSDLRTGFSTLRVDTLTVFPSAHYQVSMLKLDAVVAVDYSADSTAAAFKPLVAAADFRWPGNPWFSAGVSVGEVSPFISGLSVPVVEWTDIEVVDSAAVSLGAGGLMGFSGFWNQFGDSVSWSGIRSPWLGFGIFDWNRIDAYGQETQSYSGFVDLQRVQPWFLFVKEDSLWSYSAEIRGWRPLTTLAYTLEFVPEFVSLPDTTRLGLSAYLRGVSRAVSCSVTASVETDSSAAPSFGAGFDMLSEADIQWSLAADYQRLETLKGYVSGFYRAAPAGFGGKLELYDDSLRAVATALYVPTEGVSAEFCVASDLDYHSPEPGCFLKLSGFRDGFLAAVHLGWMQGVTELGMELSGWID